LYSSGLRHAKLHSLTIKEIDFNRQLFRITGKGNKTRITTFCKKAKKSIYNWLKIYNIWKGHFDQNASVFIYQRGGALNP
ncbi:tyrosine-type recombinase/integrase, partial [Acinetobacter baumannii]|uniref:tyrosine-type recombinase/integrase n=1 Tax=Acinetobacter baumannii TaxID=470 RepID=UPI0014880905